MNGKVFNKKVPTPLVEDPAAEAAEMWTDGVFCDFSAAPPVSADEAPPADLWHEYEQTFLDQHNLETKGAEPEEEEEPYFPADKPG